MPGVIREQIKILDLTEYFTPLYMCVMGAQYNTRFRGMFDSAVCVCHERAQQTIRSRGIFCSAVYVCHGSTVKY